MKLKMDLRQTKPYSRFLKKIGWIVVKDQNSKSLIFIRKLPLTPFSVLKIQRPNKLPTNEFITSLIKKYRIIQVNFEVLDDNLIWKLVEMRCKRQTIPFLPSKTVILDLTLSEKQLISQMKQKTRYNLKIAQKRAVEIKTVDGVEMLNNPLLFEDMYFMQRQNAKRLGIFVLPKKWFFHQVKELGLNCFSVMAYVNNKLVAATFYMVSNDGVFYSHNGSLPEGRRDFAPSACVWGGVVEGKKRGMKFFDFEGIYDERSKVVRWQGFTKFKAGFGGTQPMFPGLYSKWVWPF